MKLHVTLLALVLLGASACSSSAARSGASSATTTTAGGATTTVGDTATTLAGASTTVVTSDSIAPTTTPAPATTVTPTVTTTAVCRNVAERDTARQGDCGAGVSFIQERLGLLGFPVAIDGRFGPGTETAVKNFQSSRGITVDGIVGPATWDKLVEGGIGD